MLWACLLFPSLPLDVFARAMSPTDATRLFVVASGGHHPRVVAANRAARAAGVRRDQTISSALALAPDIVLRDRDVAAEADALAQIATWACTFTPMTSLASPNAVLAEIGGSLRLFGGLSRLSTYLADGVQALGYHARLAFAPTPGAALLLARAGHQTAPPDHAQRPAEGAQPDNAQSFHARAPSPTAFTTASLAALLAPLPLALLDLDATTRTTLAHAGITTFGQLAALPRDGLARRFGASVVALVDRALGRCVDPRPPFVPPPRFYGKLDLPAPVHEVEALSFAVNRLVHTLRTWLTARGLGITRFTLTLTHERHVRDRGLAATTVPLALHAPARMPAHLLSVIRERLTRVTLPAPVEAIILTSDETAPFAGANLGLLPGDEAAAGEVPLLDRLRARLGEDAVTCVVPHAEHRPELAARSMTSGSNPSGTTPRGGGTSTRRRGKVAPPLPLPDAPRPLWLLAEAQPLGIAAQSWILQDGPERIESGWWDGADVRRDYFVAQSPQGELMWIYRDHRYGIDDGEWFIHGLFG